MSNNIVNELEKLCIDCNTNVTELCKDAGVARDKLSGWKTKEPYTLIDIRKLVDALKLKAEEVGVELPNKLLI